MATFEQRESGYWQAKIRRKGWPAQSRTFRTKSEAEGWARGIEADMDRGVFQSTSAAQRTTFGAVASRFRNEFAPHHYRTRSDAKEAWRFQMARLEEYFGEYSLLAVDQKLVASYRDHRLKPGPRSTRRPVGDSTVRKELYLLSKVLDFTEMECGIALPRGNPVDKVRKPSEGKGRDRRLSSKEWAALERECNRSRSPWLAAAFAFSVETAVRQGELLSIEWANVDLDRRFAMLPDENKTKNGEPRPVPLSSKAIAVMAALPRDSSLLVFPVSRSTLYSAFKAAVGRAKINNFTWHDLRHEAMSRLAERGDLSILEMAAVSGHKTLQMLKRYTHLQVENLAKKLG